MLANDEMLLMQITMVPACKITESRLEVNRYHYAYIGPCLRMCNHCGLRGTSPLFHQQQLFVGSFEGTCEAVTAQAAAAANAAAAHALIQAVTESAGHSAGSGHGLEGISQLLQKQQRALLWASIQRALEAEAAEAEAGNADVLHAVAQKMVASCSSEAEGSQELGAMLLKLYLKAVQAGSTNGAGDLSAMGGTNTTPSPCLKMMLHRESGASALAMVHPKRAGAEAGRQAAGSFRECYTRQQGQGPHCICVMHAEPD